MTQVALERPGVVKLALLPPLALYVHIPWCVRKCPYCDFNSHERSGALPETEYVNKLLEDLESLLPSVWGRRLTSVFIGGGTPSLFSPDSIDACARVFIMMMYGRYCSIRRRGGTSRR